MKSVGFTLAETLVVVSIIIVAGLLLMGVVVNFTGISVTQSSKVSQGVNVNDSFMKIREAVKSASAIASSYPESGSPIYTSSSTQLVLKLPAIDSSGNIIEASFDYFVFVVESSSLLFKIFPNAFSSRTAQNQVLTTALDSLLFQYFDNSIPPQEVVPNLSSKIRTTINLRQKIGIDYQTSIATSEANLRND
ncbi:hypothetical protein HYS92_02315 [Candidatus Daviesbacteria bacterium]|nr:hypothetical protein [Candidatus Daviesbacteria bacterium]